jgi:RNA polymerase primary sigma factor
LARALEIDAAQVNTALRATRQPRSLESPLGDEGDTTLGDILEDASAASPLEQSTRGRLATETERLLDTLSPREAAVLRMRFGFGDKGEQTLEDVGKRFSVTRERIRQIEAKALRRLRQRGRAAHLKVFIEA